MTLLYPDVGQYKFLQLKSLERAHIKLGMEFDPNEYAHLSRKNLQSVIHDFASQLTDKKRTFKRSGEVEKN